MPMLAAVRAGTRHEDTPQQARTGTVGGVDSEGCDDEDFFVIGTTTWRVSCYDQLCVPLLLHAVVIL
jgi:hypothetical protein